MPHSILPAYGLKEEQLQIEAFGSGLINSTWKLTAPGKEYILQRINDTVFEHPEYIAGNTRQIAAYLKQNFPAYNFVAPLTTSDGSEMVYIAEKGFFRLFPFVSGSHSKDVVETPEQAFEAAVQFGRFTKLLAGFDVSQLQTTIPFFHDLDLRYRQFLLALDKGNPERISEAEILVRILKDHADIVSTYRQIKSDPAFRLRVTHHDTKISNVLFNTAGQGLCVIDLDTVMPGYFISDVGDMMRTYLSPVSEEEADVSKIEVRDEFYKAIVQGYYSEMKAELTDTEKQYFFYAGTFMIYMQALRFLTDYINNDVYYGARYPTHNLVRAKNQVVLLQKLLNKKERLQQITTL